MPHCRKRANVLKEGTPTPPRTRSAYKNLADLPWTATPTDSGDAVRIIAVDTDGYPYGPVAEVCTPDGAGTENLVPLMVAAPAMLKALVGAKKLWDQVAWATNWAESEPVYCAVCQAIADAAGRPCGGLLGIIHPEPIAYAGPEKKPSTRIRG